MSKVSRYPKASKKISVKMDVGIAKHASIKVYINRVPPAARTYKTDFFNHQVSRSLLSTYKAPHYTKKRQVSQSILYWQPQNFTDSTISSCIQNSSSLHSTLLLEQYVFYCATTDFLPLIYGSWLHPWHHRIHPTCSSAVKLLSTSLATS